MPARDQGLSRDDIVRAALELADSEGLDGLTMRRLGAALGRSPMGLYYYVSDRDDLLRGIYELLNSELSPPSADDWRGYAEECAWGLFNLAQAHPKIMPTVIATPGPSGPSQVAPHIHGLVDRLVVAGLPASKAPLVVATIWDFATGAVISQLAGRPDLGITSPDAEAEFRVGLGLVLAGVAVELASGGQAARAGH